MARRRNLGRRDRRRGRGSSRGRSRGRSSKKRISRGQPSPEEHHLTRLIRELEEQIGRRLNSREIDELVNGEKARLSELLSTEGISSGSSIGKNPNELRMGRKLRIKDDIKIITDERVQFERNIEGPKGGELGEHGIIIREPHTTKIINRIEREDKGSSDRDNRESLQQEISRKLNYEEIGLRSKKKNFIGVSHDVDDGTIRSIELQIFNLKKMLKSGEKYAYENVLKSNKRVSRVLNAFSWFINNVLFFEKITGKKWAISFKGTRMAFGENPALSLAISIFGQKWKGNVKISADERKYMEQELRILECALEHFTLDRQQYRDFHKSLRVLIEHEQREDALAFIDRFKAYEQTIKKASAQITHEYLVNRAMTVEQMKAKFARIVSQFNFNLVRTTINN